MKIKFIFFLITFALIHLVTWAQDNLLGEPLGSFVSVKREHESILVNASNGQIRFWAYTPTILRIQINRSTVIQDSSWAVVRKPGLGLFSLMENSKELVLKTDSLKLIIQKNPIRLDFYSYSGTWLDGDDPYLGVYYQGTEVTSYRKLTPNERFIGLGEKTGFLDRRNQSYVDWNTDAYGYGINQDPLYATFPFFMGIHGRSVFGLFFDNTYRSFFNFGASTAGTMYSLGAEGGNLNYYFFGSGHIAGIIHDYTWLTGRIPMPPIWSLGYQQSRYSYMNQQQVLDVARKMREDSIPCDVIYCDIDYMRGYRVFTWNPITFPHPEDLTDSLKDLGIHLVTIIDPGIKIDSIGYPPYTIGRKEGYFAKYPDGRNYTGSVWAGKSHFPDFTRPEVRSWWGYQFQSLSEKGVTGFWNDMNEPSAWGQNIPPIIQFGEADHLASLKQVRNIYGLEMARATFNGTRKLMKGYRPFILSRAAYSGIQRYSAMWTGDNNPTDAHMLLGFRLINSLGLSGQPFVGMDVGGFTGNPSPALMVRWMSLGTYMPLFRNHTAKGNTAHEPWAWGEIAEPLFRRFIQDRYRLLPYLYSVFYEAHLTGMPVNRSLAISCTFDPRTYDPTFSDEFLFGPNLLIAPLSSTADVEHVFLPPGGWYRLSSGKFYSCDTVIWASGPLNNLPVFVRAGGIIPLQNPISSTAQPGDGILYLQVWYGHDSSDFNYYEDDGVSYNYVHGAFYYRRIEFDPFSKSLRMETPVGSFHSRFHKVVLVLHHFPKIRRLYFNGHPLRLEIDTAKATQQAGFPFSDKKIEIKW